MKEKKLPVGYYVKQVDKLFTERINTIQAEFGLSRIAWQVLHSIYDECSTKKNELMKMMEPLAEKRTIDEVLLKFQQQDIINIENENLLSCTEKGKSLYAYCSKKQFEFRQKSMLHVSEQDYCITIATLEQIIKNIQ